MKSKSGKKLERIFSNTTSGSSELLLLLNDYFQNDINDIDSLKETYLLAKKWFTDFASIQDYLLNIKSLLDSGKITDLKPFTESFKHNYSLRYSNIFNNALPYLTETKRIITLSNSSTLYEVFRQLGEKHQFELFIAESRPKFEGRMLAKKLLKHKLKVELITDAMLSLNFPKIDAAVIGADKILKDGSAVNKTGSKTLAIVAKYYNKPFYVLCDKSKFTNETDYNPQPRSSEEIWKFNHPGLTIKNFYFEVIEKNLITKIISE